MNDKEWREDVRKRLGTITAVTPPKPLHVHIHCKGEADDWATIRNLYKEKGVIVHVHIYDAPNSLELKRILGTHEATIDEMEQALRAQYQAMGGAPLDEWVRRQVQEELKTERVRQALIKELKSTSRSSEWAHAIRQFILMKLGA